MRFHCTVPGLENNWVEVDERWTRKELGEMNDATTVEGFVGWLAKKLTACHIETVYGDPITDPATLTPELIDERVDVRLYDFLGRVLVQAGAALRSIGPFSGRLSSASPEATAK